MVNTRFVAFLDILGFSKLVETSSVNDIKKKFHKIFSSILIAQYKGWQRDILKLVGSDAPEKAFELIDKMKATALLFENDNQITNKGDIDKALAEAFPFHYLIISDSIIVYSNIVDNPSSALYVFEQFVNYIRLLTIETFLRKLPIRGAISFGEFYVDTDNSIYFGKALLDAIHLEKNQQWIGCILSDNLGELVESFKAKRLPNSSRKKLDNFPFLKPIFYNIITNYPVPTKKGKTIDYYIINWFPGVTSKIEINDDFFYSELTGDPNIDIKYHNTLEYMKWCYSNLQSMKKAFMKKTIT
jgi:hypothetical protein